jgi:hypothetical protein
VQALLRERVRSDPPEQGKTQAHRNGGQRFAGHQEPHGGKQAGAFEDDHTRIAAAAVAGVLQY